MAIECRDDTIVLKDVVGVEEAEFLLEKIQERPSCKVDMAEVVHIHTACLQVLMATRIKISLWPEDEVMKSLLKQFLKE